MPSNDCLLLFWCNYWFIYFEYRYATYNLSDPSPGETELLENEGEDEDVDVKMNKIPWYS